MVLLLPKFHRVMISVYNDNVTGVYWQWDGRKWSSELEDWDLIKNGGDLAREGDNRK